MRAAASPFEPSAHLFYVETTIPAGITIDAYRRSRPQHRGPWHRLRHRPRSTDRSSSRPPPTKVLLVSGRPARRVRTPPCCGPPPHSPAMGSARRSTRVWDGYPISTPTTIPTAAPYPRPSPTYAVRSPRPTPCSSAPRNTPARCQGPSRTCSTGPSAEARHTASPSPGSISRPHPYAASRADQTLRTVLGYTGADIVETACLRIQVPRSSIGPDRLIADAAIRDQVATALKTLTDHAAS